MAEVAFILRDVSIGYAQRKHRHLVATHLDASLESGEVTCLIGNNGVGKSTLLRTLAAFQQPLSGEILINGTALSSYSAAELAKKIGVVLTTKPEVNNLSVREVVALGRSPYTNFWSTLRKEDSQVIDESLQEVGITALANRMIQSISDGERQKMMIAKVLAQQTPVIFLDEPTAFLDYQSKVATFRLLSRLAHEKGKTILLSTHDVELALRHADRIWWMNGEGLKIGTPKEMESFIFPAGQLPT